VKHDESPEVRRRLRLGTIVVYTFLVILLLAGLRIGSWIVSTPHEALTIQKLPIPLVHGTTTAGDYITLDINFCKNVSADGRVVTTLVSSRTQLVLPTSTDNGHKGCFTNAHIPLPIPPQATPDTYHYHFHVVYKVNPLRTLTSDFDTANFKVINSSYDGVQGPQGVQGVQGVQGIQGPSGE
jgi:hypothetical protein